LIGLGTFFWLMVIFFALIGTLRGWTREVIATAGLILSLFTLNQFGFFLAGLLGATADAIAQSGDPIPIRRQQFYILMAIHLLITFFSYQGPAIAGARFGERLRIRDSLQDKVLGAIIGALNGYLIIGTLWAFLEYQVTAPSTWVRLAPGIPYPFDPSTLMRPAAEAAVNSLIENLPIPFLSPYLPFLMVIVFLFVLIVMI